MCVCLYVCERGWEREIVFIERKFRVSLNNFIYKVSLNSETCSDFKYFIICVKITSQNRWNISEFKKMFFIFQRNKFGNKYKKKILKYFESSNKEMLRNIFCYYYFFFSFVTLSFLSISVVFVEICRVHFFFFLISL